MVLVQPALSELQLNMTERHSSVCLITVQKFTTKVSVTADISTKHRQVIFLRDTQQSTSIMVLQRVSSDRWSAVTAGPCHNVTHSPTGCNSAPITVQNKHVSANKIYTYRCMQCYLLAVTVIVDPRLMGCTSQSDKWQKQYTAYTTLAVGMHMVCSLIPQGPYERHCLKLVWK